MANPRPAPSASRQPRAPQPDREPDKIVGDFERGKDIGKGSFAMVYLARHRRKRSYAAIKVVIQARLTTKLKVSDLSVDSVKQAILNGANKANLQSEIDILKDLDHPHVVALFATHETPMYYYIVMEYCELSDLAQFLKKRHGLPGYTETGDIFRRYPNPSNGGLHEVLARHFIKQLASALEYLRSKSFIHRDIKPQNLLLNPSPITLAKRNADKMPLKHNDHSLDPMVGVESLPMLKLADFGFARHLPATSMAETLCGSPLYMAPEILRYESYTAKSDLWSTGAVLYEMVVGKAPFRASNHVELLRKIEQANDQLVFDKRIDISNQMKDLLLGLLKKVPADRYDFDDLAADPVISGNIPGLVREDKKLLRYRTGAPPADTGDNELAMNQSGDEAPQARHPSELVVQPKPSHDDVTGRTSRASSDQESKPRPEDAIRRKSSTSNQKNEGVAVEMQRRPSQREQPKQRRPSMTAHATAPGRQELLIGAGTAPSTAPRMERRPSRTSPLTGPPMVREPSAADVERVKEDRVARAAKDRTAQDMAFEKEYVMVDKRAVEVNAFADELEAKKGLPQDAMTRRATTQGHPAPVAGVQPPSPSRAMQVVATRQQGAHQRAGSFERRYAPSPQSATNMLTKALNAANVRLFGALGTSPPFAGGASPPHGYGAYPAYPTPQVPLLLTDGNESKTPMDEDTKIVRTTEEAAHRSDVIYWFAEVKYRQLLPATPSAPDDALGIQQIGAQEKQMGGSGGEDEERDMTIVAIVGVAEEALVLYVKTLAILAKTIDLAGYWWSKQSRAEAGTPDSHSKSPNLGTAEVSKRMNNVVQWARSRFNECLEKSEVVGRRLHVAQKQLPPDHPGHPNNQASNCSVAGAIATSVEHYQITSGTTAERLMFERAVEMSRQAAVNELVGEDFKDCEINYITAILLLEGVLESDDEPLMRKPSAKKDKPADELINGMETEDRQTVIKRELSRQPESFPNANTVSIVIEGAKSRLGALRKKVHAAQQSAKRSSNSGSGSGNATPKPTGNVSPAATPAVAGTPPK